MAILGDDLWGHILRSATHRVSLGHGLYRALREAGILRHVQWNLFFSHLLSFGALWILASTLLIELWSFVYWRRIPILQYETTTL